MNFNEEEIKKAFQEKFEEAKTYLNDEVKIGDLLRKAEEKLKEVKLGEAFEAIPLLISLIKSYVRKEYTTIPVGTILAALAALIYFVVPIDVVPDFIPVVGRLDDAAVIMVCLKLIYSDLKEYRTWLESKETVNTVEAEVAEIVKPEEPSNSDDVELKL